MQNVAYAYESYPLTLPDKYPLLHNFVYDDPSTK
jgi:hypothetical protein